MAVESVSGPGAGVVRCVHEVRRLRDLLRSALLSGQFPDGTLPSDGDLMAAYGVPGPTLCQALSLLRDDGLIDRPGCSGVHLPAAPRRTGLDEAHGAATGGRRRASPPVMSPRIVDRSVVPAPPTLAAALQVATGSDVLRLEYLGLHDGVPAALATNYVPYPEARRLLDASFEGHWYELMADAGVELGASDVVVDATRADVVAAALLDVALGAPLLAVEQTITDPRGRVVDVAFVLLRPDRVRFRSTATVRR